MTLLSTVQNAMALCSLTPPSVVYTSTDDIVKQMVRLLYVEGRELLERHDWNILATARTFTCSAVNAQTGQPPSDFERFARGAKIWNADNQWELTGPVNADEWNEAIIRDVSALPMYWRMIGGVLNIEPPVNGTNLRYEYVSNKWIKQAGTTLATTLSADTDTFVFPERILELGLVWRFKQAKGLDYAEDMRTHGMHLQSAILSDKGGARVISTDGRQRLTPSARRTYHGIVVP
jgi:hypothetical protein